MDTTEADEAWWPPTFKPSSFGRTVLASWIIRVASHRIRSAIDSSTALPDGLDESEDVRSARLVETATTDSSVPEIGTDVPISWHPSDAGRPSQVRRGRCPRLHHPEREATRGRIEQETEPHGAVGHGH